MQSLGVAVVQRLDLLGEDAPATERSEMAEPKVHPEGSAGGRWQSSALTVSRRRQTYCPNPLAHNSSAQYPASFASPRRIAFCIALETAGKLYPRMV